MAVLFFSASNVMGQNAWINEFHYDNSGTDLNEGVEVVIENAGTYTLSDFTVTLYNGNGGVSYGSHTLDSFTEGVTSNGFTVYHKAIPSIQNGNDGFSLDYQGTVLHFISYEGSFTATDGPANGLTADDVVVTETSSTLDSESIQLIGDGISLAAFSWESPATATFGALNNSQTFVADLTAPIFESSTPSATNILETTFDLQAQLDEQGTVYYVAIIDGAPAPSSAQVKAGTDASGFMAIASGTFDITTASTLFTETVSGLSGTTDYDVYVVAEDDEATPNVQASPTLVNVTTTANVAPEISAVATATVATTFDVNVTFNEAVTYTDATGFTVTLDATPLTILGVSDGSTPTTEMALTVSAEIAKNTGTLLLSYDGTGNVTDGSLSLVSASDLAVTNNTTANLVDDISGARALATGEDVKILGELFVSFVTNNSRNQIFIEDANAGILIDDSGNTIPDGTLSEGDGITDFIGTIGNFNGVTQIVPISVPTINSTGNTIIPQTITIADFIADVDTYESRLLEFREVSFTNADGSTAYGDPTSDYSDLTDGVSTVTFDADGFLGADYTTDLIPYGRLDVFAVGRENSGTPIITARTSADIQDNYEPIIDEAAATANVTTSTFDVTVGLNEPAKVYYLINTSATATQAEVLAGAEFVQQNDPTLVATINATSLADNTQYYAHLVATDTTDANPQASVTTVTATTLEIVFDETTDIVAADAPIGAATITAVQATDNANAVNVFNFKVVDDGAADTEPTNITSMIIENANGALWSSIIAGAQITDGVSTIEAASVTDSQIGFDFSTPLVVPNASEVTYTLQLWFNTAQVDGTEIAFTIPTNHSFIADVNGSAFVNPISTAVTSATHTIDVVATELALTSVPASVEVDAAFGFDVEAVDANGNVDTAARSLDLSTATTGNLGGTISGVAMTNGSVSFSDLVFDTEGSLVIDVTDGSLNASTSAINVIGTITGSIFFSEYGEGSSNNKYVEIFNGTNATIDLSTVEVKQSYNGVGFDNHPDFPAAYSATLSGTLAAGEVYVLYNGSASLAEILAEGDVAYNYGDNPGDRLMSFTGNDAMGLFVNGVLVDLIGDPADAVSSAWDVAGVSGASKDKTLVRKSTITEGNTVALGSFGTSAADSEWEVYDQNTVTYIGFFGELTTPSILANTSSFEGAFGYIASGSSSAATVYTVSAVNLTEDLVVTAPSGFELSLDEAFTTPVGTLTFAPVAGEVAEDSIFVRFTPPAADGASYGGDILHTSAGADTVRLAVSGIEGELALSTIAEVRSATAGDLVKVTGIVVGGPNNDTRNRAIQDATAGITLFSFDGLTENLVVGDSVVVEGTLGEFRGLAQIQPTTAVTVVAQGKALPTPQVVTIPNVNDDVESQLVTIQNVKFVESGTFAGGTNYRIATATDTLAFRVGLSSHPLVDTAIPTGNLIITGVVGQFNDFQLTVETADGIVSAPLVPAMTITGAEDIVSFGDVEIGEMSDAQSFTVQGSELTEDVTVTASMAYQVSTSETGTYASAITLPVDQAGEVSAEVFVKFAPPAGTSAGSWNGDITVESSDILLIVRFFGIAINPSVTANEKALAGVSSYPNPTADVLHVGLASSQEAFNYTMLSLDGRTILRGSANNSVDIKLGQMNAGIYILEVRQDDKVYRARIAKK